MKKDDDQKVSDDELQAKVEQAAAESEADEKAVQDEASKKDATEEQIEELKNQLARAMADLQNYKRRAEEDKMQFVKFANVELLKELLPTIDNFHRSCEHLPDELKDDAWAKGVMATHDELMKTLEKIGVKRMECVGQKLDPNKHEAMTAGPGEKDVIIEEFESGYELNEQTLKPAKVKVGDGTNQDTGVGSQESA